MKCLSCGTEFSGNVPFCDNCMKNLPVRQPVYDAPTGFSFERESGFYYRRKENGIVWFDPFTGEYHAVREEVIPESVIQVASASEPDHGYEIEQTTEPIPEDFLLDEDSGCFYREEPDGIRWYDPIMGGYEFRQSSVTPASAAYILPEGFVSDPDSGLAWRSQPVEIREGKEVIPVTWFDAQTGEYAQTLYFISPSESREKLFGESLSTENSVTAMNQMPPPQSVKSSPYIPTQAIPPQTYNPENGKPSGRRSRKAGIIIAAAVGAVLLGGVLWVIFTGRLAGLFPIGGENTENTVAADSPAGTVEDVVSPEESDNDQPAVEENAEEEEVMFEPTWNDAQMEMAAREYLQRPEGEIVPDDLAKVNEVWIVHNGIWFYAEGEEHAVKFEYDRGEGNPVRRFDDLTMFPNVEMVAFEFVTTDALESDLSILQSLPNLRSLHFGIVDPELILPEISELTNVEYLFIYDSEVTDLNGIETMTGLNTLILHNLPVTDLSPLRELSGLQNVNFENLNVADYSPISHVEGAYIDGAEWDGAGDALAGKGWQLINDYRFFTDIGLLTTPIELLDVPYNEIRNFGFMRQEDIYSDDNFTYMYGADNEIGFTFRKEDIKYGGGYPLCVSFFVHRLTDDESYEVKPEEFGAIFDVPLYEVEVMFESGGSNRSTVFVYCGDYIVASYFEYENYGYEIMVYKKENFLDLYAGEENILQPYSSKGRE